MEFKANKLTRDQIQEIEKFLQDNEETVLPIALESIKSAFDEKKAIAAIENTKVVGFIKFIDFGFSKKENRQIIEIGSWVVDSNSRGKGIGQKLLAAIVELIKRKYKNPLMVTVTKRTNEDAYRCLLNAGAKAIEKPDLMVLYPKSSKPEDFYILELT